MSPDEIAAFKESGRASTTPLEAILSDNRYTDAEKVALMSPLTNLGLMGALGQRSVGGVKRGPGTGFASTELYKKVFGPRAKPIEPPPTPPVDPLTQDYSQLRGLFDVVEQTGKRTKPDKTFKKISNVPPLERQVQIANDTAARQVIGEMSGVTTPAPVDVLAREAQVRLDASQRAAALSLPLTPKKMPPKMPAGPVTAELIPPSAEAMLVEQQRRAAQLGTAGPGTLTVPPKVTGPNIPIELAGATAEEQAIAALKAQAGLGVQGKPAQLHAGLPIPESLKEPVRRFFGRLTGSAVGKAVTEAAQPSESTAHFYNSRETIFNRAFPPAPDGTGLGTKLMEARCWEDAYKGRGVNAVESTPL